MRPSQLLATGGDVVEEGGLEAVVVRCLAVAWNLESVVAIS
jgi:hypothetical protein